ncbi:hypothetical protein [Pseudonocardia humida]|uniref:hypothetical protein n=1 Tax=Pseudonocardia humida TaxID=2800819 RepID=UPI003557BF15
MTAVAGTMSERARDLWQTWVTRGSAPRELPPDLLRAVYLSWVAALALKLLGSTWDVSWHFRWLRDDLAPPHLLNSVGTAMVVLLVAFHTWTGYGVDRPTLRLMQAGIAVFLLAVPVDLVNHAVNGLDITAWSPSHAMLYLGTAIMLTGVLRGWWLYGHGGSRVPGLVLLWAFALETVWFPAGQQEYGVLSVAAWDRGAPDAEPILLQFAADQIGRPVDRAAVLHFALPVPDWVYPIWLVAAAGIVLVLARVMIGRRWAATAVAGLYVAYRCVAWLAMVGGGFPPSAVPFVLVGVALAVDAAFLVRLPDLLRPVPGAVLVAAVGAGCALLQSLWAALPPTAPLAFVTGAGVLAVLWTGAALLTRSHALAGWSRAR